MTYIILRVHIFVDSAKIQKICENESPNVFWHMRNTHIHI